MIKNIENTLGMLIYKSKNVELSEEIADLFIVLNTMLQDNKQELLTMWRKYVETVQIKNYLDNFDDVWDYTDYFTRHEVKDIDAWKQNSLS